MSLSDSGKQEVDAMTAYPADLRKRERLTGKSPMVNGRAAADPGW